MKKSTKMFMGILGLCLAALISMAGCKKAFDASGYVEAILDLTTKSDTDPIKKYVQDSDKLAELKAFAAEEQEKIADAGFNRYEVSQNVQKKWEELIQELLKNSKYTVEKAEKTESGYEVKVNIEPISGIFDDIWEQMEGQAAAYGEENAERIADGTITEEEVYSALCSMLVEDAKGNIGNIHYKDASETTVNVRPKGSSYTIDEFDLGMVYLMLVDMSGLEGIF